jgi:hypothetical protein
VVLNEDKRVIGLVFAGSDSGTVFNRIGWVQNLLGIEIVTSAS